MDPNPSESQNLFDVVTLSLDDQAYAGMFGAMTIHQCAEMCRHNSTCQAIQYDCNSEPGMSMDIYIYICNDVI
jgi:hypothetical protein